MVLEHRRQEQLTEGSSNEKSLQETAITQKANRKLVLGSDDSERTGQREREAPSHVMYEICKTPVFNVRSRCEKGDSARLSPLGS